MSVYESANTMEQPFRVGVAARLEELESGDLESMREAGIGWLRFGDFKFDAEAFLLGRPQGEAFRKAKQRAYDLREAGFQIMGLTPGPRDLKNFLGQQG